MNAAVTATSGPGSQLPALQLKTASVSAFDPDRDMARQQFSSSTRFPEPQHRSHKERPRMEISLWGGFGQVGQIRQPAGLRVSNFGRDATIIVYVSPHTSTGCSTAPTCASSLTHGVNTSPGLKKRRVMRNRFAKRIKPGLMCCASLPHQKELN